MDQLLALPIKGEAFLLRRGRYTVLVDGGWNGKLLANAISSYDSRLERIDVVVCTHADKDHASGLKTFLDNWRLSGPHKHRKSGTVGQFWLPGSWADSLQELVLRPVSFFSNVIAELDELVEKDPELAALDGDGEDIARILDPIVQADRRLIAWEESEGEGLRREEEQEFNLFFDDEDLDIGTTEPVDEPQWFDDLRRGMSELIEIRPEAQRAILSSRRRILYRRSRGKIGAALADFWLGLISTASSIRAIAETAIHHQVRIRWFDFDRFALTRVPVGGVPNFLVPLNVVEQAPTPKIGLSYLARLSPVNEACLAFLAPPSFCRLGVVFCGDTPLGDGSGYGNSFLARLPGPRLPVVATAPHHGSESNQVAYGHLGRWANVMVWVRTGGTKLHPGKTFKQFVFPRRICTHCTQRGLKLQRAGVACPREWPFMRPLWIMGHHCACT